MKKLFSFIAILSLILTSCEGLDMGQSAKPEELFSAADLAKLDGFDAEGGAARLTFTPDYDWEASANRSWITIDPESGVAGEEVKLKVSLEENTTDKEREGNVIVELNNGTTCKIKVRQLAGEPKEEPIVELVDGKTYDIEGNGGNLLVKVRTNTEYEVVIPTEAQEWLSVADTRAMREETLTFTATKNETGKERSAKVTLTYNDGEEIRFTIYQDVATQNPGGEEEEPVVELVNGNTYDIDGNGGNLLVKVRTNTEYEVVIPTEAKEWLSVADTRAMREETLTFTATKNDTGAERSATVRVTYGDGERVTFTIHQGVAQQGGEPEEPVVELVNGETYDIDGNGGNLLVKVRTNTEYKVVIPTEAKEWLSVADTRAMREETLTFTATKNDTGVERSAKVTLTYNDGEEVRFTIHQEPAPQTPGGEEEKPVVELVDGKTYDIDGNGGNLSVKVRTNTEYKVVIPTEAQEWLSVADTRAMREETLTFTATKNETGAERSAKVTLTYNDGEEIIFTIYQDIAPQTPGGEEEKPVVELVDGTTYDIEGDGGKLSVRVRTNTEYEVYIPSTAKSWLSIVDTRAMREDILTFVATKNDSGSPRQAKVKVFYGAEEVAFTINQATAAQEEAYLSISPRVSDIAAAGGTVNINVTTNAYWTATSSVSGISISPNSGNGNATVTITVPANSSSSARDIEIQFTADLNGTSKNATAIISQSGGSTGPGSSLTPSEHQRYLESVGQRLLTYFNPEDSRSLMISITDLANNGGFDFYLEGNEGSSSVNVGVDLETSRGKSSVSGKDNFLKRVLTSVLGVARFSPEAASRLSTTLILPDDDGTYSLDDYKGKQYRFNYKTSKWQESDLGDVNKCIAKWDTSVLTLTWEESSASWEGYIDYKYKAKVEGIPSKLNLNITVDGITEFTTDITVSVPNNYAIDTNTAIWLKGNYAFSVVAKADSRGVEGSVVVAKNGEKLATGGGKIAINDMTDSNNWWKEYTDEWFDGYQWHYETYTDLNWEYPVDQVKTGEGYATILDVALQAQGNLRTIIDESKKIDDPWSKDGSALLCNHINSNASARLYYTGSNEVIANIKAEPQPYTYWGWNEATQKEEQMTEYDAMPVLIFTDGSKFAVDDYFTEVAFGNLIDAAEALWNKYVDIVE